MPKLVFLDLETTGLDEDDQICELAFISVEDTVFTLQQSLCLSTKKIKTEAMALHHITNEMLKQAQKCEDTKTYATLQELNKEDTILIMHNSAFTLNMLQNLGFHSKMQVVDTLRCTKALIPECDMFNLQFLRYELLLYKKEEAFSKDLGIKVMAHRAFSDALHVKLLFDSLLEYVTLSELITISSNPILMQKLPFGKYSGRYIEEIAQADRPYLLWMMQGIKNMDEDLKYSLEYYLENMA